MALRQQRWRAGWRPVPSTSISLTSTLPAVGHPVNRCRRQGHRRRGRQVRCSGTVRRRPADHRRRGVRLARRESAASWSAQRRPNRPTSLRQWCGALAPSGLLPRSMPRMVSWRPMPGAWESHYSVLELAAELVDRGVRALCIYRHHPRRHIDCAQYHGHPRVGRSDRGPAGDRGGRRDDHRPRARCWPLPSARVLLSGRRSTRAT